MKTATVTLAVLGLAAPAIAMSCGVSNGYDKGTAAYYFNNNGSLANFASCSALCVSETKCESFAFGDSQCLLYAEPLDDNFRYQANSPFLFYDRNCSAVQSTSSFITSMPATSTDAAAAATSTAAGGGALAQTTTTTSASGGGAAAATSTSASPAGPARTGAGLLRSLSAAAAASLLFSFYALA